MKQANPYAFAETDLVGGSADYADQRAAANGFVILPDEKKYMDRLDRKSGDVQQARHKRARVEKETSQRKTALEREPRLNQAFDSTRQKEEKQFNDMLDDMLHKRRESRAFEGHDEAIKQVLYGSSDAVLYKPVDMFEPLDSKQGVLQHIPVAMRKRLTDLALYDRAETHLIPMDLAWRKGQYAEARLPAGRPVNIALAAEYLENNTSLDVWTLEVTIPNKIEEIPAWVRAEVLRHYKGPPDDVVYAGLIALEVILDELSTFHMRFLYCYGLLSDKCTTKSPLLIRQNEMVQLCREAEIPEGDNRLRLERHAIRRVEDVHPIFALPAIYIGRYYFSPAPPESKPMNSLENLLKSNAKLSDARPIFDLYDDNESKRKKKGANEEEDPVLIIEERRTS